MPNLFNMLKMVRWKGLPGFVSQSVLHLYDRTHDSDWPQAFLNLGQHSSLMAGAFPDFFLNLDGGSLGRSLP